MAIIILEYIPSKLYDNYRGIEAESAWKGLETVVPDIIEWAGIETELAIEFGVWLGYSTSILAQLFRKVIGVDTFLGDQHSGFLPYFRHSAEANLSKFNNVELVSDECMHFISNYVPLMGADLIHIDIEHTYQKTYELGKWAVNHADLVLFHDTESYPEVKQAVSELSRESGRTFYNYANYYGLGILAEGK